MPNNIINFPKHLIRENEEKERKAYRYLIFFAMLCMTTMLCKSIFSYRLVELHGHILQAGQLIAPLWFILFYALAARDSAIWDTITKSNHVSLHAFLGGRLSCIPAYGTTGWLSLNIPELIQECEFYRNKGINAFKLRLGHPDDIARVSAIRTAMGDDFQIMVDANQRYAPEEASEISTALSPFRITWLEEPTDNKLENIAAIKKSSCIPIALGETIIEKSNFEAICRNKLTDILQLDLPRCGGITGFCEIAKIAMHHNIPLCSHLMYEVSIGLLAAFPNAHMLEYDNLLPTGIFAEAFPVSQGCVSPAKVPGNGATLTEAALRQFQTDSYHFEPKRKLFSML